MFQSPWKKNLYVGTLLLFSTILGMLASNWLCERVSFQRDELHPPAANEAEYDVAAKTD